MQPEYVPPNLRFIIDDIEEDWEYENNPFDYVHGRYLAGSIKDWPRLAKQAFKYVFPSRLNLVPCPTCFLCGLIACIY